MLSGINHIGIAVKSIDEAARIYVDVLGGEKDGEIQSFPETGMRALMVDVGNAKLELMDAIGTEGLIAKYIASRGEGVHHLCLEVDDIVKMLADLAAKGFRLIDKEPRDGMEGKIAFIHPKETSGVLVELVEPFKE